jgi:CMP-N,N'-diacetyllegionaminic acid synthase
MIAIIPARAGSKRLPRKNVLPLKGKPLIAYTIEAALEAHAVDEVYISTDDKEVIDIALNYGVNVPFCRPPELCTDTASTEDVCEHMLDFLRNERGLIPSSFMFLQATSPLRTSKHIDDAVQLFTEKGADAVIGVSEYAHPVQWALRDDKGIAVPCVPGALEKRSQDLEPRYHPNGALYIFRTDFFRNRSGYYGLGTVPFIMTQEFSVDVDTKVDFALAEFFLDRKPTEDFFGG